MKNEAYPKDMSCHVRDPKVWKMDGRYYMVLGARTKEDVVELLIYESEDKYNWKHINVIKTPKPFGYMWECPDIFCLDGQWIVMTSPQGMEPYDDIGQNVYSCGYFPLYGDFRGEYTLSEYHEADKGFDYYAPQSFEAPDGRRIVIGWMGMPDAEYSNPTTENLWQHCIGNLVAKMPLIQGGMGVGISLSSLAGAVAREGGIGIISTAQIGYREPDYEEDTVTANLRAVGTEIKKAKELAEGGIVGVNIMVATRYYEKYVEAACQAGADLIISGAGLPAKLPAMVQDYDVKIAPIVSSVKAASGEMQIRVHFSRLFVTDKSNF